MRNEAGRATSSSRTSVEIQRLVERIRGSDHQAFVELYRLTSPRLFGVLLRISGDRGRAEEMLQELYVKVWHGVHLYQSHLESPLIWMLGMARDRAMDDVRHDKTRFRLSASTEVIDAREADPRDAYPYPSPPSSRAQEVGSVREWWGKLTASQRQRLALAYFRSFGRSEVATVGHPQGTIETWIRRARTTARTIFEDRRRRWLSHPMSIRSPVVVPDAGRDCSPRRRCDVSVSREQSK